MLLGVCRYTSVASLETLGQAYKQGTELVGLYYDAYFTEAKLASDLRALAEAEEGVLILEQDLLIKKVAQPLSESPFYTRIAWSRELPYLWQGALVKSSR